MKCIFGHWVFGIWNSMYWLPGGGFICEKHAREIEARGLGRRS